MLATGKRKWQRQIFGCLFLLPRFRSEQLTLARKMHRTIQINQQYGSICLPARTVCFCNFEIHKIVQSNVSVAYSMICCACVPQEGNSSSVAMKEVPVLVWDTWMIGCNSATLNAAPLRSNAHQFSSSSFYGTLARIYLDEFRISMANVTEETSTFVWMMKFTLEL